MLKEREQTTSGQCAEHVYSNSQDRERHMEVQTKERDIDGLKVLDGENDYHCCKQND